MRQETKLIKDILNNEFPNQKFKFRYIQARNYIDSSDKIKITCEKNLDIEDVIKCISKYVLGIKTYRKGSVATIYEPYNIFNHPKIMSIVYGEWIDVDVLEFIEVGY